MGLFHSIDDAQAVVRQNGTHYQLPLYSRDENLYVKKGGGYVSLRRDGRTAVPGIGWEYLEGVKIWVQKHDATFRLVCERAAGYQVLLPTETPEKAKKP